MDATQVTTAIKSKGSFLCVGLDTDPAQIPAICGTGATGVLAFNKAIIEATAPYAAAFKVNVAFYEAMGKEGWAILEKTRQLLPSSCYLIADAKRGDIGNTAAKYAEAFFGHLAFDALTVSPYMGTDTLLPYLAYPKGDLFVLACTSNPGFAHFENQLLANGNRLYEEVVIQCGTLPAQDRIHFVAGATQPEALANVRRLAPASVLLVPGVGAQGGDLKSICQAGLKSTGSLLVNASRSILYASSGQDFAEKAAEEAQQLALAMSVMLQNI
jgi:orotidine-5'-phosphate decarboxylase